MNIPNQFILIIKKMLDFISWTRILKVGVVSVILILSFLIHLINGPLFLSKKPDPNDTPLLKINSTIRDEIDDDVKRSASIVGIQIVTINFEKNIRLETYVSIDSAAVQKIYNNYLNNKVVETVLFDEDKANNTRVLRLINGEFICMPYKESLAYRYAPEGIAFVSTVCAIGIPPSYGEFSGIFIIYLKDKPDRDMTEKLFLLAREISVKIYDDNKVVNENKRKY